MSKEFALTHKIIECLGGLTNHNYKFEYDGAQFVFRAPGKRTQEFIDRKAEAYNARIAYEFGLGPEIIYCDGDKGSLVTRYIHKAKSLSKQDLKCPILMRRVLDAIKSLHSRGPVLSGHFDPFNTIDRYLRHLKHRRVEISTEYQTALRKIQPLRDFLKSNHWLFTACHNDTQLENFLDTGDYIYLIDWEYAGNGDALWDLATLSIEAEFDDHDDKFMLGIYLERTPNFSDLGRLYLYKVICDLVWTPWSVIQAINGNNQIDYYSYGLKRCRRALDHMQKSRFKFHLANIQSSSVNPMRNVTCQ